MWVSRLYQAEVAYNSTHQCRLIEAKGEGGEGKQHVSVLRKRSMSIALTCVELCRMRKKGEGWGVRVSYVLARAMSHQWRQQHALVAAPPAPLNSVATFLRVHDGLSCTPLTM